MKNIFSLIVLSLLLVLGVSFTGSAQTYTMTGSADTVTNTGTKACSLKVVNNYSEISIQVVITKISGTVAGTVTLQGSVDGTTFETIDTLLVQNNVATFTATDVASQSKVFVVDQNPYLWYKLSYTGSGTMSATLKGYLLPRKLQ